MATFNARGLHAEIFKWSLGDCSARGISSTHKTVTILSDDPKAPGQVFEPSDDAPAVYLVRRSVWPNEPAYVHAEPLSLKGKTLMAGGTFIYSGDSRYFNLTGTRYPISLHDRNEF